MSNAKTIGELNEGEVLQEKRCEWKIPNQFTISNQNECFYLSPSFTFLNVPFCLRLCPPSPRLDILSVYLMCNNAPSSDITFSFSIKKLDGTLIRTVSKSYLFNQTNGFLKFFKGCDLRKQKCELLPKGTLTIVCDLKSGFAEKHTLPPVKEESNLKEKATVKALEQIKLTDFETLSENFKNLFLNKESCDTTLHVMDKEYKVHKTVLMARSSVFASMFLHETSEKQTGIVDIPDCDPESFGDFLLYLYSGELEKPSPSVTLHLYQTSEKYNVQKLKTFCSEFLIENLTVEHLCDVVIMADKYDDTKLFSAAQSFFNKNLSNVFPITEWKDLMINHHRLANKLLMEMSSRVKVVELNCSEL